MAQIVQLQMDWPETVRDLVAGGKYFEAINEMQRSGARVPDDLLAAAGAMLTAGKPGGHTYTVSRYLNRVRITATLKRPVSD